MPVVLRLKGYKIWFYQADLNEPPHVHIGKDGKEAKYWLTPISLARTGGFKEHELSQIEKMLNNYHQHLLDTWQEEIQKREANEG